jgi:hypothetical protein
MADTAATSSGDDWWDAISKLTGFEPPKRADLFKDHLFGNNDIPLMKMEFSDSYVEPSNAEAEAINELGQWRTQNSGWRVQNTDFVVPFYYGSTSIGSEVQMRKARITLLGTTGGPDAPGGGVSYGGEFTEHGSHLMGDDFKGWDSRPLAQYSFGGGIALEALLNEPYSTWRFTWNDSEPIDDTKSVDLTGFDRVASAFDRAAQFFHTSRATIQSWEDELGSENAAWRGQAAGVFWDITHQLGVMYQDYTDTLPTVNGVSKVGEDLRQVRTAVYNALSGLHSTWNLWVNSMDSNPLRVLHDVLLEVTDDIWYNNITKVRTDFEIYSGYETSYTSETNKVTYDGFRVDAHNKNTGGSYGDLNSFDTWKNIGTEAVKRWQKTVDDKLGKAGHDALVDAHNSWVDAVKILQKLTTPSISLVSDYQMDKAAAEQDKADKAAADAAAHEKEMEDKAAKERADDLAHQKEMEDKAAKERADDLAHQKEMEDKAEKDRQEQEQHQKEQEDKAEKDRQEQEQHQKEQEQKQEEEQKHQEELQKEQYDQQRKDQQEQEQKQEQQQKEQEQKQEEQQKQQLAMQIALQKEQEKKQEEQQKKQEELQKKQEQKQEEQQKQQEELQKKQEQKQEEQQRRQEEQQKQQYDQQRKDQQEQEKKQEEQQKKQEEQAQQQYQQQQKTQADYQQQQQDQQKQQEDQAKQQYEQQRKDQQDQQAQQDQQQKQLEQQYQQVSGGGDQQQHLQQQLQQQQDQYQHQLENLAHNQMGSQTHVNPDGTVTTDYSDGSSTTVNPHTGAETTTLPDGSVSTDHVSAGHSFANPDGSTTTVNDNGTLTTHYPDGSTTTVDPSTGVATTHEPDGQTITTNLGGGATLPHVQYPGNGAGSLYEPELHDLPYDGSLGSALSPAVPQTPGSVVSPSGGYLPQGTYMDGTTTGGMPPAGTPMTGGTPAGGMGGMPMGGMGGGMGGMGGMGGGEKNGSAERVRQVYDDDDIVSTDGGSLGRRSRRGADYEREAAAGRRTPTSGGDPYGGGAEREQTESGDRERESWVPEEEDVWGTDEGGSPAVIG